jgi:hypothetical protein
MKQLVSVILLFSLYSCNQSGPKKTEDNDTTLLSTSLVNNPNTANGVDSNKLKTMPTIDFKDSIHAFGTIQEGEIATYDFAFTNNGLSPLVISNATGSCGCTVADYPHEPVLGGKGGAIKVQFNSAGKTGHQEKTVSINSNAKGGVKILYIKGDVTPGKKEAQAQ